MGKGRSIHVAEKGDEGRLVSRPIKTELDSDITTTQIEKGLFGGEDKLD